MDDWVFLFLTNLSSAMCYHSSNLAQVKRLALCWALEVVMGIFVMSLCIIGNLPDSRDSIMVQNMTQNIFILAGETFLYLQEKQMK